MPRVCDLNHGHRWVSRVLKTPKLGSHMLPNTGAAWLRSVLRVIKSFADDSPWRTAAQVASRSGLSEPDAHGLLLVLCGAGLVRMEGHRFLLTPGVLDGAFAFTSSRPELRVVSRAMA